MKKHFTFFVETSAMTPELAKLLDSPTLRSAIVSRGDFFRVYDVQSPIIEQKKLGDLVKKDSVLIVQKHDGKVIYASPIPKTEEEILSICNEGESCQ